MNQRFGQLNKKSNIILTCKALHSEVDFLVMLDTLRQNSRSFLVYALFGVLIVAFVVTISPSRFSKTDSLFSGTHRWLMRLDEDEISTKEFENTMHRLRFDDIYGRFYAENQLRSLGHRLLLVAQAKKNGLKVTEEDVVKALSSGIFYLYGTKQTIPSPVYKERVLDYKKMKNWVEDNFGLSLPEFLSQQVLELLAFRFAQLNFGTVYPMSNQELTRAYEMQNSKVQLSYVRFPVGLPDYEKFSTDEAFTLAVKDFSAKNNALLKKEYSRQSDLYSTDGEKAHIRKIVKKLSQTDTPQKKEDLKKYLTAMIEQTKAANQPILTFARLAQKESQDVATAAQGGQVGWIKKGKTSLDTAVEQAVFSSQGAKNQILGPFEKNGELFIIFVQSRVSGPINFETAIVSLAEKDFLQQEARDEVKKQAEDAMNTLRSGRLIQELFPNESNDEQEKLPFNLRKKTIEESKPFSWQEALGDEKNSDSMTLEQASRTLVFNPKAKIGDLFVVWAGNTYYLVVIKTKEVPVFEKLPKNKQDEFKKQIEDKIKEERRLNWLQQQCLSEEKSGRLKVNSEFLDQFFNQSDSAKVGKVKSVYSPCKSPSLY